MLVGVRRRGDRSLGARSLTRRFSRWAGFDRNPLRRGVDRVERAAWMLLVVGFVVAAPLLAPLAGHAARADGLRLAQAERSWRQVNAVLVSPAPGPAEGYSSATVWVQARWHAPSGADRSGLVPTQPGARSGTVVRIWVNHAGIFTGTSPFTTGMIGFRVVTFEILATIGLAIVVALLAGFVRWLSNRRRMAYWALEWACIGPRWSARH